MTSSKALLHRQAPVVGVTTQHVTQPWLARLWNSSGCDFVYLEHEHGFFNESQLADFVLSCRMENLPVVSNVPECLRTHVTKLLECGVIGIQLPGTESWEQIDRLVSYVKFKPVGIRAAAPGYGNCDYRLDVEGAEFIDESNKETTVIAHIETQLGVESINEILSNPHVDIVFLGMYYLSVNYGHPGQFEYRHVVDAVARVITSTRAHNKVVGMFAADACAAEAWFTRGATFFETASEVDFIALGGRNQIEQFRALGKKNNFHSRSAGGIPVA